MRNSARLGSFIVMASLALPAGCGFDARWPSGPVERRPDECGTVLAWQLNGAKRPNYFQRLRDGRIDELRFDDNGDGKIDEVVDRTRDDAAWPHCILVLDGAAYDVAKELWDAGRFRLFAAPSRMISVFPAMTDLAMTRIFRTANCVGPEALYFDKTTNRMRGGSLAYLSGDNAPWLSALTYHAPQDIGAKAYLQAQEVFDEEMRHTLETFRNARTGTVSAYSIGAAGLGTRGGRTAMRAYLLTVEQLCERVVYEKRGRVRITLLSDHGHNLKPLKRVKFDATLQAAGLRRAPALNGPTDVVIPSYGLVTYAAAFAQRPAEVAAVLIKDPAVELVAYAAGDRVIVLTRGGEAAIRRNGDGYFYEPTRGDPLELRAIIEKLKCRGKIWPSGALEDIPLFNATAEHRFPDPLHRLWTCFNGLMQKPPDLVVSTFDTSCHGSWLFEVGVGGQAASTHGALDLASSSAIVLSDIGPLPKAIRIDDVLKTLSDVRAQGLIDQRRGAPRRPAAETSAPRGAGPTAAPPDAARGGNDSLRLQPAH